MVSNGTHCYKRQQGAFVYDATQGSLRIDYLQSSTVIGKANMTEHFYHLPDGTVHPEITKYAGVPTPVCPCIDLGVGPVSYNWAADAEYIGREELGIEFLWQKRVVDHFVKGPHHVWSDVKTGAIVRLWQPFNGLEVFDPAQWEIGANAVPTDSFKLPLQCRLEAGKLCINGTSV